MKSNGQQGMTLIEVLIAMFVLSVGLVGVAAMQYEALQSVHSAHYRSIASAVALDLEERLWLELADDALSGCPDTSSGTGTAAAALISHWNRAQAGGEDAWDWSTSKMVRVPNLTLTIAEPIPGTRITQIPITLSWGESRFSDVESTTEEFTYTIRILCRVVGA